LSNTKLLIENNFLIIGVNTMKSLKTIMLLAILVAVSFGFNSCQKSDSPTNPVNDIYSGNEFMLPVAANTPSDIAEATLTTDMMLQPPMDGYLYGCMDGNGGKPGDDGRGGMMKPDRGVNEFARIFRAMKVTPDQLALIRPFMEAYRACIKDATIALRESEKAILQNANARRKELIAKVQSGEITREEAKGQMQIINQETRQLLKDNPARLIACEAMKACKAALYASIRETLTAEQQVLWDEWVGKQPVIDCTKQGR
jgi:hypothetical protein